MQDLMLQNLQNSINNINSKMTLYPTTNTGNVYTILVPHLTVLTDGYPLRVKFMAASTGAISLIVNTITAKAVIDFNQSPVTNVKLDLIANLAYVVASASFILQGKGGGGNTVASHILLGDTATNDTGLIIGTMPNNGVLNYTPSNAVQTIPFGYVAGGTVAAVNVPAAKVLNDTTIAGVVGTMNNIGSMNMSINVSGGSVVIDPGYTSGGTIHNTTPVGKKFAVTSMPSVNNSTISTGTLAVSFIPSQVYAVINQDFQVQNSTSSSTHIASMLAPSGQYLSAYPGSSTISFTATTTDGVCTMTLSGTNNFTVGQFNVYLYE